jgi:hypothetical protein
MHYCGCDLFRLIQMQITEFNLNYTPTALGGTKFMRNSIWGYMNKKVQKNGVFWDVTPCGSSKNDVSEELSASIIRVTRICELEKLAVTSNRCQLPVTANVVHSSPILVTLMMEALSSSETSVLTRGHTAYHPRRRHSS